MSSSVSPDLEHQGHPGRPTLVGRSVELGQLTDTINAARLGAGTMAAIDAPAGMGKSTVLDAALTEAQAAGLTTVRVNGRDRGATRPFGTLVKLVPEAIAVSGLTWYGTNSTALHARHNAAPVLPTALIDQIHVMIGNSVRRAPAVYAIDDAHLCDEPSLAVLAQLSQNLDNLPLSIILSTETSGRPPQPIRAMLADFNGSVLRLSGLAEEHVGELLARQLGRQFSSLGPAVHELTGGRPQLVVELADEIRQRRLAPDEAVLQIRDIQPSRAVAEVQRRLAELPTDAAAVAKALAVVDDGAGLVTIARVADRIIERVAHCAIELRHAGLIRPEARSVSYTDRLTKSIVHNIIDPEERAKLHHRAATFLSAAGAPDGIVAAHAVQSPPGLSRDLQAAIKRHASTIAADGDPATAAKMLVRLADEYGPGRERDDVVVELGRATEMGGIVIAEHLLHDLAERRDGGPATQRAKLTLARIRLAQGQADGAVELLADLVGADASTHNLEAAADLVGSQHLHPGLIVSRQTTQAAEEALRTHATTVATDGHALFHDTLSNNADVGVTARRAARLLAHDIDSWSLTATVSRMLAAQTLAWCDELSDALRAQTSLVDESRRGGAAVAIGVGMAIRSSIAWASGQIDDAEADAMHALLVASRVQTAHPLIAVATGTLHSIFAVQPGDAPTKSASQRRAAIAADGPDTIWGPFVLATRGELYVAEGHVRRGVELLRQAGRVADERGWLNPAALPWRSALARALSSIGQLDEANALASFELQQAQRFGSATAIGRSQTALATALPNKAQQLELLYEATTTLTSGPARLEHARTLIVLGTALWNSGFVTEARDALRQSEYAATMCGASRIAATAREQLLATGARPRRMALIGVGSLTPMQRHVAELAAAGDSNRTIARKLYVSHKTVETHLSQVYSKLGVRTRHEIAAELAKPQ